MNRWVKLQIGVGGGCLVMGVTGLAEGGNDTMSMINILLGVFNLAWGCLRDK